MENVSAGFLATLKASLGVTEIVSIAAQNFATTLVTVVKDGVTKTVTMDKVHISKYLGGQEPEVTVEDGTSLKTIMEMLSEKYKLDLLPDVDYVSTDSVVVFGKKRTVYYTVGIEQRSVAFYGSFTFAICNKAHCCKSKEVTRPDLREERVRLLLAGEVFESYDVIVVGGAGIGKLMAQQVVKLIKEFVPPAGIEVEDLLATEVIAVVNDGISDIAALRLPNKQMLFLRYKLSQAVEEPPLKV